MRNPGKFRLGLVLSALALIGQLWLPFAHAMEMADASRNPLVAAFCGTGSPALLAKLRAVAPPELLAALERQEKAKAATECTLCGALQLANLLPSTPSAAAPTFEPGVEPLRPTLSALALPGFHGLLPPPTGPPHLS